MSTTIHTLALGSMDNFIHIIADTDSGEAIVVDPGWDAEAISDYCFRHELTLVGILLTHTHADHVSAVNGLLAASPMPVYLSREEYRLGLFSIESPQFIAEGESVAVGNNVITAIATPGHTLGSMCYQVNQQLITGDTLFIDGCGRCNFLESDVEQMWYSLQRLKQRPDELVIYCGHNYGQKATDTLGQQKQTNPYLLIEDKAFFIEFRMHLQSQYRSIPFTPSSSQAMADIRHRHLS